MVKQLVSIDRHLRANTLKIMKKKVLILGPLVDDEHRQL